MPRDIRDIELERCYDIFGNPVRTPINRSVIDPYHPANNVNHHSQEEGREYTFRQRTATPLKFTLGWELEANRTPLIVPDAVQQIGDGSVNGAGAEYVVLPAVTRSPQYVLGLLKDLVHAPKLNTDDSCGFHVHVSASNIPLARMRQWAFATEHLAMMIEDLAFKAVPESRKDNQYCRRISPMGNSHRFVSSKYSNPRRYHWLNTVEMFRPNGIRTIENRLLGHTHRWKYVLSWALFTMELANHGWQVANKPFTLHEHISPLEEILKRIANEIKPLTNKNEPVPQWVYNGLMKYNIKPETWDRPLEKLVNKEYQLNGYPQRVYSDDQPEIPSNDDDTEYCECGCDTEGRCDSQMHDDGDCDSNYCGRCHDNGDCGGSPSCEQCIDARHEDGEDCERSMCRTCHPRPAVRPVVREVTPVTDNGEIPNVPVFTYHESNSIPNMSNVVMSIDPALESRIGYQAFYIDEAANSVPPIIVEEGLARQMLDGHEEALTMERVNTPRSCISGCTEGHDTDCLMCGQSWGNHSGHRCFGTNNIGSFPLRGGR